MESLKAVRHLFVMVFVTSLAGFMVISGITDVTIFALYGGRHQCLLAIYFVGLHYNKQQVKTFLTLFLPYLKTFSIIISFSIFADSRSGNSDNDGVSRKLIKQAWQEGFVNTSSDAFNNSSRFVEIQNSISLILSNL